MTKWKQYGTKSIAKNRELNFKRDRERERERERRLAKIQYQQANSKDNIKFAVI